MASGFSRKAAAVARMSRGVGPPTSSPDDPLAAADAPRRHSPSAAPFRRAESRLGSYPRCARRRGEWRVECPRVRRPPPFAVPGSSDPGDCAALPLTRRAGTGRPRPTPRAGKSSPLVPSLRSLPRRVGTRLGDRCQAHRCAGGSQDGADHTDRTRREESPRRLSGSAALDFSRSSAARAPLRGPRPSSAGPSHAAAPADFDFPLLVIARF